MKKKIKNMNSKMTTNSRLPTAEPKKKNTPKKQKQTKQRTRTGTESEMEITWRVISREGERENG